MAMTRRSFVRHQLERERARFVQAGDVNIATDFGDATAEAEQARTIALADLSALPRSGFKGPGTVAWLSAQGIQAGADPNRAFPQADESLVAMLSWSEALILDDPLQGSGPSEKLIGAWTLDSAAGCYALPRRDSHYWFALCGVRAAEAFSKLCPIDLQPEAFANFRVAQTTAARSNVILIRSDIGEILAYHVLGECGSAQYMWECLTDAMEEFSGRPVGLEALRKLRS